MLDGVPSMSLRRPLLLLVPALLVCGGSWAQSTARTDGSRVTNGGSTVGKVGGGAGGQEPDTEGNDKLPPVEPKAGDPKGGVARAAELAEPAPPRATPRAPTSESDDRSSWETWWLYNRESLLDLRRGLHAAAAPVVAPGADGATSPDARVVTVDLRERRVLPALERIARVEEDPVVLGPALIALARAAGRISEGSPSVGAAPSARAALLIARLAHAQAEVGEAAALALGILGEPGTLRALLDLARDTSAGRASCARDPVPYRLRSFAAYGAGLLAAGAANEDVRRYAAGRLLALCESREAPRDVQAAAVSALGLVDLLSGPETWQASASRTAKSFEPTASREALVAHLAAIVAKERGPALVRAHALTALVRLALGSAPEVRDVVEKQCIAVLQPNAREPNELVQSAALGLARLSDAGNAPQDREARECLMAAAHQADLDTRHFALLALGESAARPDEDPAAPLPGAADVHRFLLRELTQGRGAMRSFAALALGLSGHALRAQGRAPSAEAGRALEERFAKGGTPDEVAACALALALRGERAALEPVRARLAEAADDLTRSGCAVALGLGRVVEARASLQKLLQGARSRPALLREASIALALLDEPTLAKDLAGELARAPGSAAQAALLQALAHVGDATALDVLLAWSADATRSAELRGRAVAALGAISDPRRLPWNDAYAHGANYLAEAETLTNAQGTGILDRR
jgi:hypothetical protein